MVRLNVPPKVFQAYGKDMMWRRNSRVCSHLQVICRFRAFFGTLLSLAPARRTVRLFGIHRCTPFVQDNAAPKHTVHCTVGP
jgi:hypothetical protein